MNLAIPVSLTVPIGSRTPGSDDLVRAPAMDGMFFDHPPRVCEEDGYWMLAEEVCTYNFCMVIALPMLAEPYESDQSYAFQFGLVLWIPWRTGEV